MEKTPVQEAVEAKGQAELARMLEVSDGMVWQWYHGRRPVAPRHCPRIEAETGVRCEMLRPDIVWTRDNTGQITGHHVPIEA